MQTKATLQEESLGNVKVIVDNEASQQNVQRFLESQGFQTEREQDGVDYLVIGTCGIEQQTQIQPSREAEADVNKIMVMCATDRIGFGDEELGLKLIMSFIKTLKEMGPELWRLVFVNNGLKLTIEGSEVLEDLKDFENRGLKILVCGTCLTHFGLLEAKRVGSGKPPICSISSQPCSWPTR